jgi:hypothetical protein
MSSEKIRIIEIKKWRKWGPYLSERQWGTVREDYSPNGDAWNFITHSMSGSYTYRWGEEGIGGISDDKQFICFAPAFWNGKDPVLKENLFGLTNPQGNHGEDVKEYYYYLDNLPTHSYMKFLYKYPQQEFPYHTLWEKNKNRNRNNAEFELIDTGILDDNKYFDIFIEYAKKSPENILIRIKAFNRGKDPAGLNIIPQAWFRNTWSWQIKSSKPRINKGENFLKLNHNETGEYFLYFDVKPKVLFCDNQTNLRKLYGINKEGFFKDGINDFIVNGNRESVNKKNEGTKAALNYFQIIPGGKSFEVKLKLTKTKFEIPFKDFDKTMSEKISEADEFYKEIQKEIDNEDEKNIQRQAFAGMLWSKQFYYYNNSQWINGDPSGPTPPASRRNVRNSEWVNLDNADIISMPDKWEFPWYATWDTSFHCIPFALIDPEFAKEQLLLFTKECYMHPNGQLPAYEWDFSDVNPPVHAWAVWRVYKIDEKYNGKGDIDFLERVFHKLLLNFTWWVNKKDKEGRNIFQGGFLGMDNIGVFDRSTKLPDGGHIDQADGTSWVAMYCLNLMRIAIELSQKKPLYQDLASKFFEHFLYIAKEMINMGGKGIGLWDNDDEFYYDVLHTESGKSLQLKLRSMVGLIPLFAVEVLDPEIMKHVPEFEKRLNWFLENKPELANLVSRWCEVGVGERNLLSLLRGHRMKTLLQRMLDETEFLSDYGIRSLSKVYEKSPYIIHANDSEFKMKYIPAESDTGLFGGNSNWRGPIWFPVNFLIIESLQRFHHYYGDEFKIKYPSGSNNFITLNEAAGLLTKRLKSIFLCNEEGKRPVFGNVKKFQEDPHFKDYIHFYEYFHGETGCGLGASHQTGWTGLIAKLLQPRIEK